MRKQYSAIEDVLLKAEKKGIRLEVLEEAKRLQEQDNFLTVYEAVEIAYDKLKNKLQWKKKLE
jgi:hypothetical protein